MSQGPERQIEVVVFDSAVFDLDTVKRAIYRFSDRFSADIAIDGSRIVCSLTFKAIATSQGVAACVDELRNEVLDQDLRRRISSETAPQRNAILALAFSNPKLRDDE